MKFGPVSLDAAEGTILAHSLDVDGKRLRKGRILDAQDVLDLRDGGFQDVVAARLENGDVGEDVAADLIAQALVSLADRDGLRLTIAKTGRVNVYATGPGVLELDVEAIEAANRVDPMITIATLSPYALVAEKTLVATVKIIAYGVSKDAVQNAASLAKHAMRRRAPMLRTANLIQTEIGSGPGKGEAAMRARLSALGLSLDVVQTVPHQVAPLAEAIEKSKTDLVLLLTASATSDPHDVAPEALRLAGGAMTRFGMPVDPGNLLFIGDLNGRTVIGLPGCARSPALNGADWVLERIACGVPVTDSDIAAMGVGGLLKESPARPHPREKR